MLEEVWYTVDGNKTLAYKYSYSSSGALLEFENCITGDSTYYTYTKNGQLQSVNTYNENNELSRYSVYCRYDEAKNFLEYTCVTLSYLSGVEVRESSYWTQYEYNADELLWIFWIYLPQETTGLVWYGYDESNRLTEKVVDFDDGTSNFNNEIEITYKSSSDTSLSTMIHSYKSTVGEQSVTYTYTYDGSGNITRISYSDGNEITYEYDNLDQHIRENNSLLNRTYTYEYDNAGNIEEKRVYALTPKNVEPTELIYTYSYGYTNEAWGDQLTSFNGTNITYDELGNPINYYTGDHFTWQGRRLVKVEDLLNTLTFTYDDNGIRQSKTVNGVTTNYYWSGSMLIAEETEGVCIVYLYDDTGAPIGFQYRTPGYAEDVWDTYLYEKNLQGDIIAVYNLAGEKLVSYTYDAWGNFTTTYHNGGASTTATKNNFRYRSYYYDTDLGLYYLMSRYYDSNTGRFISPDTSSVVTATPAALTDKNLYAYCDNNPVMRVDEGGEFWNILIGAAVGAVVSAAVSAVSQLIEDRDSWKTGKFWAHVGVSAATGAISGGLAASGVLLVGQVVGNAILGLVGSVADARIDGETSITTYMLRAVEGAALGAVAGRIGGNGTASKHLTNSFKRVLKSGNWSYYFSQIGKQAFKDGLKSVPSILKATTPILIKTLIKKGIQA